MTAGSLSSRLGRLPWLWSYLAAVAAYLALSFLTRHFTLASLVVNLGLAGFLTLAGLGQMFAITGGAGGIDLSVPSVLTLAAMLSTAVTHGANSLTAAGAVAGLALGLAVGLVNGGLVVGLRLPPIVATLATGFVLESFIQISYPQAEAGAPSPLLENVVRGSVLGLPWMLWISLAATVVLGALLQSTLYGRHLEAAGQNETAARLTRIAVGRVRLVSYALSGLLASLTGVLLAAYAGGAFLDMGAPYQLGSIAAVVLGGSLIAGGRSTATGVFGGSLLLTFLVTLMEATGLPVGLRDVIEGLIIVLVLAVSRRHS
jgi:ribose transport system permease protein